MDVKEILKHVDHTLLKQTATWEDIKQICDDGIKYGCASVCIPPDLCESRRALRRRAAALWLRPAAHLHGHRLPQRLHAQRHQVHGGRVRRRRRRDRDRHGHQPRLGQGGPVRQDPSGDQLCENLLPRQHLKGHHRDLPAHRRREDQALRGRLQLPRRLYQDLHGLCWRRARPARMSPSWPPT